MVGGLSSRVSVRRGGIWRVDFDALDTDDLRPVRPALIITAVALKRARRIVIATPSAGQGRVAGCDQVCAVDKGRLTHMPANSAPPTSRPSRTGCVAHPRDGLDRPANRN
jgi:hypothetical protein